MIFVQCYFVLQLVGLVVKLEYFLYFLQRRQEGQVRFLFYLLR